MPTNPNRAGDLQKYNAETGKYTSGETKKHSFKTFKKKNKVDYFKKVFGDNVKIDNEGNADIKHYVDDDNINVVVSNIEYDKNENKYVMWIDGKQVVYLDTWNVNPVKSKKNDFIVKLNRQYFAPTNKGGNISSQQYEKAKTFNDFVEIAKAQDMKNKKEKI